MPTGGIEQSHGKIWTATCPTCSGSEQLYEDDDWFYKRCLNCSRETLLKPKPEGESIAEKPYEVMEQARLKGFSCGVSEECLTCPLQRCENAWFKQLIEDSLHSTEGRLPHPHPGTHPINLNNRTKHLLQRIRWDNEKQSPPVPLAR